MHQDHARERKNELEAEKIRKSGERAKCGESDKSDADSVGGRENPRSGAACRGIPVTCTASSELFGFLDLDLGLMISPPCNFLSHGPNIGSAAPAAAFF